jgi:hypothetical protein
MLNRGLKLSRNDRTDPVSSQLSSNAGESGRRFEFECIVRISCTDDAELYEMELFAECTLGLGWCDAGLSLNRLSRYAGLVPQVDGRGRAMAILLLLESRMALCIVVEVVQR